MKQSQAGKFDQAVPEAGPLAGALGRSSRAFIALALISCVINVLMLTGSVFMIQIYDRVLSSRSMPTLAALSAIALTAYIFQGGLDAIRARVLALVGERIDGAAGPELYKAVAALPLIDPKNGQETLQPFRDLEAIRGFMSGAGPIALLDMPWLPVYIILCYLLHPLLGYTALLAACLLVIITLLAELRGRGPMRAALAAQSERNMLADNTQRGAEAARAMGMVPALAARWNDAHIRHLDAQRRANFATGGLSAFAKMTRLIVQSLMLGLGAYLAIKGEISAGTIVASSILAARALAPVDQAIANWRGFIAARQGYARLKKLLGSVPRIRPGMKLPAPEKSLAAEALFAAPPGVRATVIRNINLKLTAGETLGIIGPSASGKSTLARTLTGVWLPLAGKVTLDGANIHHWDAGDLGPHVGYLPQDVQLFDGTIAENIARFQTPLDSAAVLKAAADAGFREHIFALPGGFETPLGRGGFELSAGQRQRLGLARALYGDPFLVVLDEPNSNLDAEGEAALTSAIAGIGERGGIGIIIAHRPSAIAAVSVLAVMRDGEIAALGPRDEILSKTVQNAADIARRAAAGPITLVIADGAGWHGSPELAVPENIVLLKLPSYGPELNPAENIWEYLRGNTLSHQVRETYEAIVEACRNACNGLMRTPEIIRSIATWAWAQGRT